MDLLYMFRTKVRHKVSDFQQYSLKLELFKVKTAKRTFAYEIDILERRKYEFEKVGTIKKEDAERLVRLLHEVDAYVNGLR